MSIVVQHSAPNGQLGALATAVGQGRSADRQASQDEERGRWLLGLRENQRQFDINTALRVQAQDLDYRQYNQSLARQDATQQAVIANQEANRQAQIASQQMREEYGLAQQQQEQMFQYAMQSTKTVDEQVYDAVESAQQMKLNPEGQRLLNESMGRLREIQQYKATARPMAYASLLDQWLTDFQSTRLSAYNVHEPSAQEEAYSNLVPMGGQEVVPGQPLQPGDYLFPVSVRNGVKSWKQITVPNSQQSPFAEDIAKNTSPAPDGGFFYKQPDGKIQHIPPAKPEKVTPQKPVDMGTYVKEAIAAMRAEHSMLDTPEGGVKPAFKADPAKIKRRAKELKDIEDELSAEVGGGNIPTQSDEPPAEVSSMEEAMQVPEGKTFIYNGQTFIVTGPGEAEPL